MVGEGKIEKIPEKPLTFFAKVGFKPLKKQLSEREIVDKLSDELLKGEIKMGDKLKVECKEEGLIFHTDRS